MQTGASDEDFMRLALVEAKAAGAQGEVPIGAIVVRDGEVVAVGSNLRETWRDPTAHAELIALQAASRRLGTWRLTECDLYVTLEPCPMCAGSIMLARIRRLVYGADDRKGGAVTSKLSLLEPGLWNHTPNITSGVLAEDCANILKEFFKAVRERRTNL
ncbi:tRNA adenosine(34) deaminase TadA [Alicyclobacillus fastidiosus]|uniref:tRNA-specific adenosine deaminase n=1 Tax=Alicyclobacillus fastidiosus TaxID=392011 RepID=A0ABY6ZIY9_9BACL|nr:tRNA adenosine(34) deaminase TadA [Alicyclobacillus fastidiosus]WAH42171.1 tRNA adenosine(34) deaminase TadA [Alicyclobacillus fastidiosus]GMA63963.1 tRNA-specific adenosine deaminase [Alicyclobacillus fastidiosus]